MSGEARPTRFAVLASGKGSNFEAIMKAISERQLNAQCVVLISDQPKAPVLEKAESFGIPVKTLEPEKAHTKTLGLRSESRSEYDERLFLALNEFDPEYIVLAGFMRILSPQFIKRYTHRIINIHPSLLPAFPGLEGYQQAFNHGCGVAGVSVHFVTSGVDQGPLCAQRAFDISSCKNEQEVMELGLAVEHKLYPATLQWIFKKQFQVIKRGDRTCVRQS
jgi:phosphoribosylglycinamide formyltransferase-1